MLLGIFDRFEALDFSQILPAPETYKNQSGGAIFGYDGKNLTLAVLHMSSLASRGQYAQAVKFMDQLRVSLEIETLALNLLNLVLPRRLWERFGQPIDDGVSRSPLRQLVLRMYERFTGQTVESIEALLGDTHERGLRLWKGLVPDEDHPTFEQLSRFYNSMTFPEGDLFATVAESHLSAAYRCVPLLLAQNLKAKGAFDYGGGSGLMTSALAQIGLERVVLIEENQAMLDFARWRDQQCGIGNVHYLRENQLISEFAAHTGQYDFGVCTEVLEHVLDVEGTVQRLAQMIRPGGYLFLTASFGLYPYLSHLKPNVKYCGREDELMHRVGFVPMQVKLAFPLLNNMRLYQRQAASTLAG